MANARATYDVTWYAEEKLELVKDIPYDVLLDLWCIKFGKEYHVSEEAFMDGAANVEFYRAATAALLKAGLLLKQIDFARAGISFYVKEKH
jgi:hypothetical protein